MKKVSLKELFIKYGFYNMKDATLSRKQSTVESDLELLLNVKKELLALNIAEEMNEKEFVEILEKYTHGRTEVLLAGNVVPLEAIDCYVCGLVIELNRLGFNTGYSCDGHDRNRPIIGFQTSHIAMQAATLLQNIGIETLRRGRSLSFRISRYELPIMALTLNKLTNEQAIEILENTNTLMPKGEYFTLLDKLLNISGVSGDEDQIRNFVLDELSNHVDHLTTDNYGNIIAQVSYGQGPTILLNAHLDTVDEFSPNRIIIKNDSIWSSSEGILGADDRAGICAILATVKKAEKSGFKGTLKIIFTVEEEIGLIGARAVNDFFLWDTDIAFVVDRRGTGDLVTSCYGMQFCTEHFARRIHRNANERHPGNWQIVQGGSSDTRIWASQGINSINISAGYFNEHTEMESLDVEANYRSYELLIHLLQESRLLMQSHAIATRDLTVKK
ncbi:M20/M25/M40 family metallo-hydrolase [Rummeliibacillus sp. NPDC094406]|uniref:M20/M25/M40 family metallo-hydrolase n=1 Tax=Rummeliibacillus sp. NPDC094406 TaxID=3364511 RepID=UPI00380A7B52